MKTFVASAFAAVVMSTAAYAAPVNLADMNLNGNASISGSSLILTPSANSQNGTAFIDTPFAIDPATTFSASFEIGFSQNSGVSPGGADGISFLIHNGPNGANQTGTLGGGIGYQGITPSLAVEFDTWNNGSAIDDDSDNHVGIAVNGDVDSTFQADPGFTIQDQTSLFAWVDYDGAVLDVFVSLTNVKPGTSLLSAAGSLSGLLGNQAYFGFTASTGAARSLQQVNSFDLDVSSTPAVPLPASGLMLLGGLALAGGVARRRKRG